MDAEIMLSRLVGSERRRLRDEAVLTDVLAEDEVVGLVRLRELFGDWSAAAPPRWLTPGEEKCPEIPARNAPQSRGER